MLLAQGRLETRGRSKDGICFGLRRFNGAQPLLLFLPLLPLLSLLPLLPLFPFLPLLAGLPGAAAQAGGGELQEQRHRQHDPRERP
ncbi:unnamed protein product [Closterium sp. NIES-53]